MEPSSAGSYLGNGMHAEHHLLMMFRGCRRSDPTREVIMYVRPAEHHTIVHHRTRTGWGPAAPEASTTMARKQRLMFKKVWGRLRFIQTQGRHVVH
jgi:hypothetical protein